MFNTDPKTPEGTSTRGPRCGLAARCAGALVVTTLFCSGSAEAQRATVDVRSSPENSSAEAWQRDLETRLTQSGRHLVSELPVSGHDDQGIPPGRVHALRVVEEHLRTARRLAATLQEGPALSRLAEARRLAEDHADVPGVTAWLAEVETAIGIVAAQAGRSELSEQAFLRAVTLDPDRGVRSGEAPPAVVATAAQIARTARTAPTGSFEVRSSPPGAEVYLDDTQSGPTPQPLRTSTGRHVLRIEMAGYHPYGRVIEVLEGARPTYAVALAPDAILTATVRLRGALPRLDVDAIRGSLAGLGLDEVWSLRLGTRLDRALLTSCGLSGCSHPVRVSSQRELNVPGILTPVTSSVLEHALHAGERWLDEAETSPAEDTPLYAQGWFWAIAGGAVVAIAATVLVVLAVRPDPETRRQLVIDPTTLDD